MWALYGILLINHQVHWLSAMSFRIFKQIQIVAVVICFILNGNIPQETT